MRNDDIYLDYNATNPPYPEVIEAVGRAMVDVCGNASSIHAEGQRAKAALDVAREQVAALLDVRPTEIVFTSGGTEADNLALRGAVASMDRTDRTTVIVTAIEHEAVLVTARSLERDGFRLVVIGPDSDGVVPVSNATAPIDDRTALVSVMLANNETGVVQPVAAIAEAAHACGAIVHTDAIQAAGRLPVRARALGADLVSISAHKFGGPKGAGALWVRAGTPMTPIITGGRQERSRRAGTENVPALVGMGVAAEIAARRLENEAARIAGLRDRLERALAGAVQGLSINGAAAPRLPNTSNMSFDEVEAESLVIALDLERIAVSTGAACSSGSIDPSHVLAAMGLSTARVQGAVRISLGHATTAGEIDRVASVIPALVRRLRGAKV